jgi:hypothetical protein
MKKGTKVKYQIVGESRTDRYVQAIIRTAHRDGTFTVEAQYMLIEGRRGSGYLGYRYRMPRHRLHAN